MVNDPDDVFARAKAALREVIDPELGINIVDLGLVMAMSLHGSRLTVDLTMTTAACPIAEVVVEEARRSLLSVPGLASVDVRLVWEPVWTPERMSDAAKAVLGWRT
jgi:metal-sulfur cluster biosynthetic enzyme